MLMLASVSGLSGWLRCRNETTETTSCEIIGSPSRWAMPSSSAIARNFSVGTALMSSAVEPWRITMI